MLKDILNTGIIFLKIEKGTKAVDGPDIVDIHFQAGYIRPNIRHPAGRLTKPRIHVQQKLIKPPSREKQFFSIEALILA